ncbi:hypothetical protein [Luteolibacter luteus]|uniref:Lipoprotein n=1 Tax=Luteolibacter luteus TaxID=2728835 RepID=A0A858RP64_9BACT|nr:hypothetical protein [Luteolibacter luteus]QJE98817.1 hypothetical protein HHL09_24570 [Luteolibacter luteus]
MKTFASLIASLAMLAGSLFLGGCASTTASSTEPLLSAAGFTSRTPENAKQQELYNQLTPYKVQRGEYKGKVMYAYKDEKKGVAYVGDEAAYQRYQKLAVERRIARDNYEAAQMNRDFAYGWYGAYGPYYGYGYPVRRW